MSSFKTREAITWAKENLAHYYDDPCDDCAAWVDYIKREGENHVS